MPNNFITPRDYNNTFAGIRAFNYFENASLATADNILNFNLGSPADFIVTNDLGQRVGKDPVSGVEYNEIPNAYYGEEIYESEGTAFLPEMSTNKILYIIDPTVGEYDIDVIGTGTGEYTLSNFADLSTGESEEVVSSSTFSGGITSYTSNFSNDGEPEISIVSAPDTQSPKADISIDPTSWTSVIDGLDTSGEPAITQQGNNYTLTDIAGNTTLFTLTPNISTNTQKKYTFSNFIQNGQNISIPITRVEYTRQLGQQNSLKKLTQKIIIKDVVTVEAVYNSSVDKTVITKTYPNPIINPVTTEVFDGVKIIHLTAVNGEVDYEY